MKYHECCCYSCTDDNPCCGGCETVPLAGNHCLDCPKQYTCDVAIHPDLYEWDEDEAADAAGDVE
jgi:hypothetical protein